MSSGIGKPNDLSMICTVGHGYSMLPSQLEHSVHVHGSSSWLIPCSWNTASSAVNMFLMRSCASSSVMTGVCSVICLSYSPFWFILLKYSSRSWRAVSSAAGDW